MARRRQWLAVMLSLAALFANMMQPVMAAGTGPWWIVANPTQEYLSSVAMAGPADGWIVGGHGVILHWDGLAWRQVESPTGEGLGAVSVVSPQDAWAVGNKGAILHWDGSKWWPVSSPITTALRAISMLAADEGWAGGDGGVMLRWHNGVWSQVAISTTYPIVAIAMLNPGDGWASAYRLPQPFDSNSPLLRWNGQTWELGWFPIAINDLALSDAIHGWAVGGVSGCSIWRWQGEYWYLAASYYTCARDRLNAISIVDNNEGWIVGRRDLNPRYNGTVYHLQDGVWELELDDPDIPEINDVAAVSASEAWALAGHLILHRVRAIYLPQVMQSR